MGQVTVHSSEDPGTIELVPVGPIHGTIVAPTSKSLTNRLLVIAALASGTSLLSSPLVSDDTDAMISGLRALGVAIEPTPRGLEITGSAGRLRPPATVVAAGLSGTTIRFLSAVAALVHGEVVLDGDPALRKRPIGPLADALRDLGAEVATADGHPPLRIVGHGVRGGHVVVDASASSQFATGLLLIAPYAEQDVHLDVSGLADQGYVQLTVGVMSRWGARVSSDPPGHYVVGAGVHYEAADEEVEHDASAAAHLYALAVATGGDVTVANAGESAQPDAGVVAVLEAMGATVRRGPGGTTVGRNAALTGVDVDLAAMPDQVPTVAVLGALATGRTRIRNVAIARGHETDRLASVAAELRRVGGEVDELPYGLVVHGGLPLHGGRIETYHDHRMAMAFAALAAVVPGVEIADPSCVAKTYPGFWVDLERFGLVALERS
jgi:3-phosphoshikimate 1-carboxyvinyltransferase